MFKVAWEDSNDPEKGFKYLYLTPDDYQDLVARGHENVVNTKLIQDEDNESRYKITSVIGKNNFTKNFVKSIPQKFLENNYEKFREIDMNLT